MTSARIRSTPRREAKIPFWVKATYDLSQPGDKADIAKLLHRVIYRCNPEIRASHRTVLAFIFDRTIGWDKFYERITYEQFQNGVFDGQGYQVAPGTRLSRRTIARCLADLMEWGILLRRIETGCKQPNKHFYAINLGAGVGVKNRNDAAFICRGLDYLNSVPNLFQPEKQAHPENNFTVIETVWKDGKMTQIVTDTHGNPTTMLPIPKRLRAKATEETDRTMFDAAFEEFGETPPTPVEQGNSPQFTSSPTNGSPRCNLTPEKDTEKKDTEPNDTETCAAGAAVEALQAVVKATRNKRSAKHSRDNASIFEKANASVSELERIWKNTHEECFGRAPIPWTAKQRGQIKELQRKWIASNRQSFSKALTWFVQRWQEIGLLFFNFRDNGQDARYPSEPSVGFLAACFDTYVRAYDKETVVDEVPAMSARDKFVARLRVRGWEEGRIQHLAAQKFDKKERPGKRDGWKDMIRDMGEKARAERLQPVATDGPQRAPQRAPEPVQVKTADIIQFPENYDLTEWR